VNRQAQAVVMLLLGGAVVRASVTDLSLRYVKSGLRPLLVVAGLLLVATAVMTLWYEVRGRLRAPLATSSAPSTSAPSASAPALPATGTEHEDGDDDGHGHTEPRIGWLLTLPVVGLLLISPPALGSFSAGQAGSILAGRTGASDYPPLPAGNPVRLTVLDYGSRAVYDTGKTLTGRTVQLTGFVTPGPDGQLMLARIVLSCCAADGRPIKVGLSGNAPTGISANTWVTLVGRYDPRVEKDPVNDAAVPYLQVTSWQETAQPEQPYE
jgi:uncharacterized repeat protein (TIGR03943 family)